LRTTGQAAPSLECPGTIQADETVWCPSYEITEERAPEAVQQAIDELYAEQQTGDLTCSWDRCGTGGGYVCTGTNLICLWQRETSWVQCAWGRYSCLPGGNSCYTCERLGVPGY